MIRKRHIKFIIISFFCLIGVSFNSYAFSFKEFIIDLINSRPGSKYYEETEGKDLTKFTESNQCEKHYIWGRPTIKDKVVNNRSLFICRKNFAIQFDSKLKVPLWVSEVLNREPIITRQHNLNVKFKLDDDLPSKMQPTYEDYLNTQYFPVQLATVYNMSLTDYNKNNLKLNQEYFNFSNTAPMVRENLGNTIWIELEEQVRAWVMQKGKLIITTGVIYLNGQTNGSLKKSGTLIPTHFYKIITHSNSRGTVAFIIPNKEILTKYTKKLNNPKNAFKCNGGPCSLSNFIVSVKEIERVTNTEFYPQLTPQLAAQVKF